jgi:hypothetical protein
MQKPKSEERRDGKPMKRRWLPLVLGAMLFAGPALLAQEESPKTTYSLVVKGIV